MRRIAVAALNDYERLLRQLLLVATYGMLCTEIFNFFYKKDCPKRYKKSFLKTILWSGLEKILPLFRYEKIFCSHHLFSSY